MWSSFFLVAPPSPFHILISNPKQCTATAVARPNRRRSLTTLQNDGVSPGQVGELGHTLVTALPSNPPQISGSDVLWALQRASERTKKKKKKQQQQRREEESSSVNSLSIVDYADVRPLRVKSEWSDKLDELEKRLRELSEII
ncbi:uncharacterized protein LOC129289601 [Prosopis cineraria]|uniref:uncharacterized protein LOC129289601 n=1 Tax=Prosopis cineraria TaxID=364024 RepID=UPI00241004A1|nr:uncharacterized protein LOC129289601 [Prosopis cineraria]